MDWIFNNYNNLKSFIERNTFASVVAGRKQTRQKKKHDWSEFKKLMEHIKPSKIAFEPNQVYALKHKKTVIKSGVMCRKKENKIT